MRISFEWSANYDLNDSVFAGPCCSTQRGVIINVLARKMNVKIKPLGEIDSVLNDNPILQLPMNVALGVL